MLHSAHLSHSLCLTTIIESLTLLTNYRSTMPTTPASAAALPPQVFSNIHDHGTSLDDRKKRVKCNYCAKVVSGFSRLKQHLGGVGKDVLHCQQVPQDLQIQIRNDLLERKSNMLSREVLQLFHSDSATPPKDNHTHHESVQSPVPIMGKRKHVSQQSIPPKRSASGSTTESNSFPQQMLSNSQPAAKSLGYDEKDSIEHAQRCIGRFFYENGIDFDAIESPSFQKLINAVVGCGFTGLKVPNCNELKGWMFHEEMEKIHQYVKEVRQSWKNTGCSILLDGWTDDKGRNLVNFLVDCPQGPIYLRTADISDSLEDVNAFISVLDGVIEEVGIDNLVQVITYTASTFMEAVGKQLVEKHKTIFWSVCASHCICLMVEKIGMMAPIEQVLSEAKTIMEFVYNHAQVLKLMRLHANGFDLVNPSCIRLAMPFLTLENIIAEEDNLKKVFGSSVWKASIGASTSNGRRVAELVEDPSFWSESREVLKATIPLVRALHLISGGDNRPQVGYIYETMDQTKEAIKKEFKSKKAKYMTFWEVIDAIWNNQLHSPLHAAAYFLNPSFFFSADFFPDAEVASGILCCIVRMMSNKDIQDLISLQLDEYRGAKGSFGQQKAIEQRTQVSPAKWWSLYGGECPELQRFAIRILCQTCSGGLRYDLKRSFSEQLHSVGTISTEQRRLDDMIYLQHNLQLLQSLSAENRHDNLIVLEEPDLKKERVVDMQQVDSEDDDIIAWMRSDRGFVNEEEPSSFQPKDENTTLDANGGGGGKLV